MAAMVSPTPFASYASNLEIHQYAKRNSIRAMSTRPHQAKISPSTFAPRTAYIQPPTNDSSDDEDLAPIKLSAEAQAILGEDNSNVGSDKENVIPRLENSYQDNKPKPADHKLMQSIRRQSPDKENGSPAPRVVRVDAKRPSPRTTLARDGSFMYKIHEKSTTNTAMHDSKTPAQQVRRVRISGSRSQTRSPPASNAQAQSSDSSSGRQDNGYRSPEDDQPKSVHEDEPGPAGPSTIMRPRQSDESAMHSTMRVRRIGTGTLLNRPVRRGMVRRQSDEENGDLENKVDGQQTPEIQHGRRAQAPDLIDLPDDNLISYGSPKQQTHPREMQLDTNPPPMSFSTKAQSPPQRAPPSTLTYTSDPTPASNGSHPSSKSTTSNRRPVFKIPSLPPLDPSHDQENEPPPTFKRNKPTASFLETQNDEPPQKPKELLQQPLHPQSVSQLSPSRQPLALRSNNTPHRPAPPPPPKMSLVEAATSSAGNSRNKKSVHYVLNNRTYRRLDCIGRGGSSRVFRIMAENYKIFALKRVNLEEADMAAIAGYKGEIDLLQKLSNVDRVIRLFDYEINEDKGVLNVMMELGESDFNKMLNEQLKGDNAKLDVTFTRHYWKEMLECVKAVHEHDIVHSDLKPANFLLVKGQLKLIDFGIANAIQDNTVNVHRENQIGTPNYMSPESLVCHTPAAGSVTGQKILKLGKPSDVWSLGCILYQMTYGQPPFAHITKQFERIMSIPNPKVEIQFPGTGIGGAVVPFGLIKTLRRCLQRDQVLRPTITDLLSESDPFLNPVAISPDMLGRVIGNVMGYCRKREEVMRQEGRLGLEGESCLPRDEEMRGWPGAFYEKLRVAGVEGSAW